ncbi:hypothetical protein K438DRAFT_2025864 [Mycena galopus ATCC 62051]|nr:hypothetical protein K438DRAFT_2025864 [Mycena galopus ATCC 62051]
MNQVSCVFPHPSCTSIAPFVMQMKRLRTFISRLSSVEAVTLDFDISAHAMSRCLSAGTDSVLNEWASQDGALLNCIVQRECSSLTIMNGGQLTAAHQVDQDYSRSWLAKAIEHVFSPDRVWVQTKGPSGHGQHATRDISFGGRTPLISLPSTSIPPPSSYLPG